ncbi:MAG TPA: SRPBCC family protein [Kofleriaceae bacterium]|nr:SRPBCC family protein [Kofleriaceae bacterium]
MKLGKPLRRAITIGREPLEVYNFWRKLELLPKFMYWIESVEDLGNGISRWKVKTPAGAIEYDAELVEDVPGHRISWRTLPGATVPHRGTVDFVDAPGGRGTEVIVEMQVAAPLGKTIASQEAGGDLRRLKQILEIGELIKSDASIHEAPHPAQPEGSTP